MSAVVSPFPPLVLEPGSVPAAAQWWRLRLTASNEDGSLYTLTTDGDPDGSGAHLATWIRLDFIDGEDTILDAGLDRPSVFSAVLTEFDECGVDAHLDLLSVDQPTPCAAWRTLSAPGVHGHPDHPGWPV